MPAIMKLLSLIVIHAFKCVDSELRFVIVTSCSQFILPIIHILGSLSNHLLKALIPGLFSTHLNAWIVSILKPSRL